jgi:cell division protein FtsB
MQLQQQIQSLMQRMNALEAEVMQMKQNRGFPGQPAATGGGGSNFGGFFNR